MPFPEEHLNPATDIQELPIIATCKRCGHQWQTKALSGGFLSRPIIPTICTECDEVMHRESRAKLDRINAEARELALQRKNLDWQKLCPRIYRTTTEDGNTEIARLELLMGPKLKSILAWQYTEKGLILQSRQSGRGKTRAAWRLLRRLFNENKTMAQYTAGAFQRRAQDEAGKYSIDSWFNTLSRLDIVFLDDLGKGYWTENTEALWFDLVEHRTRDGKPVLVTTNYNGKELIQGSRSDAAEFTVRRLREFCDIINLD